MKSWIILLLSTGALWPQANIWHKITENTLGSRSFAALFCDPSSNRVVAALGVKNGTDSATYDEIGIRAGETRWRNLFPDSSLYGVWGDSFGTVSGKGRNTSSMFGSSYFCFKGIAEAGKTYLRPYLGNNSRAYWHYAWNPDDRKVYFYVEHRTFTYDPATRRWDTLTVNLDPADYQGGKAKCTWGCLNAALKWGSLCYDPVNHEMVLFGGGGVDARDGHLGTWTYSPATRTWTKLTMALEPEPRTFSRTVYDPATQSIILFGGDRLDRLLSDTWAYRCSDRTWIKKNPPKSPSPRACHAFLYLPQARKLVLVGGYTYTPSEATASGAVQYGQISPFQIWTYDASADTWALVKSFAPTDTVPWFIRNATLNAMAAADTNDNIIALGRINDAQYAFQPYTFVMHCDPSVTDAAGTQILGVDPGAIVRRTGMQDDPGYFAADSAGIDTAAHEAFLRNVPADVWTNVNPPKSPIDRVWSTRIYNPDRDEIIVWGGGHSGYYGNTLPQYSIARNRWAIGYDAEWGLDHLYESGEGPGPYTFRNRPFMYGHPYDNYDYDVNLKRVLIIKFATTYVYDPVKMDFDTFKIKNPPDMPGYYYHNSVTQTPHGCFAWSNTTPFGNTYQFFLMDKDSLKWRKLPVTGAAPPVYWCEDGGACYESRRDRMIFISRRSDPGKVWTYDFKTGVLEKLTPSGTGPVGTSDWIRELVYLPEFDVVYVQGGFIWDCATHAWRRSTVSTGGTSTVSSGYFYDEKRKLIWDVEKPQISVLRLTAAGLGLERSDSRIPARFGLCTAGNPSNGTVAIIAELEAPAPILLTVYAADGRLIRRLVNGERLPAGSHRLVWNGRDAQDRPVAGGSYTVILKAGRRQAVTRSMLMR